jgi:hypothetical protein
MNLLGLLSIKKQAHFEDLGIDDNYINPGPTETEGRESLALCTGTSGGLMRRQ